MQDVLYDSIDMCIDMEPVGGEYKGKILFFGSNWIHKR